MHVHVCIYYACVYMYVCVHINDIACTGGAPICYLNFVCSIVVATTIQVTTNDMQLLAHLSDFSLLLGVLF